MIISSKGKNKENGDTMESQRRTTLSTFLVQIKLFLRLGTMKEIKVDTTV
jgi:hypothetical protein